MYLSLAVASLHHPLTKNKVIHCPCCEFSAGTHPEILFHFEVKQHKPRFCDDLKDLKPLELINKVPEIMSERIHNLECSICLDYFDNFGDLNIHIKYILEIPNLNVNTAF